jgi:hypothetical protein
VYLFVRGPLIVMENKNFVRIASQSETMCGSALTVDFPDRKAVDAWLKDEPCMCCIFAYSAK